MAYIVMAYIVMAGCIRKSFGWWARGSVWEPPALFSFALRPSAMCHMFILFIITFYHYCHYYSYLDWIIGTCTDMCADMCTDM